MSKSAMNVTEVAEELGISISKAYGLVKEKGFPALRIGKRIVIPKQEFELWLKSESRKAMNSYE